MTTSALPTGKVVKLSVSTSNTTRCPFINRNSTLTNMVMNWLITVTLTPLAGSTIEAKAMPICTATI
ncbi:hypothetical protein D3C77_748680 [compost metagenome]